jgi:TolB-like protein/DNA-binding winged helix-turn-helix (wHTH) protein/Tfp pilus assembly protein PilF
MAETKQSQGFYEFGPYRLYPAALVLMRDGGTVPLTPKVLDTLKVLVERAGQPVSKAELLRAVWPDTFVEESNLAQNISVLRKALGAAEGNGNYIETIAKRGYRFVAEVRLVSDSSPPAAPEPKSHPPIPGRMRSAKTVALALLTAGLCAAGGILYYRSLAGKTQPVRAIAVIPLRNVSGDPAQNFLADGITELLITELGKTLPFRVTSPTSSMRFRDSTQPIAEIGRELGVDAVVEGSVARSADRFRVTTQLIHAADDRLLWAETYDLNVTDALLLEEEIARAVAHAIRAEVLPLKRTSGGPVNRDAFESCLRARYFLDQRTEPEIRKAITWYQKAIDEDPAYAASYAGLADCYNQLGTNIIGAKSPAETRRLAAAAARRALEIDPDLAEAHASLAYCDLYDWNWAAAERGFQRAIQANPNYAPAHLWFAHYLTARKQFERASQEVRLAHDLDPLSPVIQTQVGWLMGFAGRHSEAIELFRKVLEDNPRYQWALWQLGHNQIAMHDYAGAIETLEKVAALSNRAPSSLGTLGYGYGLAGRREDARRILNELTELSRQRYVSPKSIADVYEGLGDRDKTFEWFERCFQEHANAMVWLDVASEYDELRSDARFQDLRRRVGLN